MTKEFSVTGINGTFTAIVEILWSNVDKGEGSIGVIFPDYKLPVSLFTSNKYALLGIKKTESYVKYTLEKRASEISDQTVIEELSGMGYK